MNTRRAIGLCCLCAAVLVGCDDKATPPAPPQTSTAPTPPSPAKLDASHAKKVSTRVPEGQTFKGLVMSNVLPFIIQLGKHGEKHRSCGQKCVQNGQPIGLLTQDGSLYMLMPEEHDPRRDGGVDAKASASDHMGHIVSVTGTEATVGGYHALYVQGLTK